MGVLSATSTVTMASATDLKPWPMSGPLNHAEFPGYNPVHLPTSATLITNYLEPCNEVQYRRHVQKQQQLSRLENEYVTSPCRKSMYSAGPQQHQNSSSAIPLYETVRPKSACYVEDELNLKGKDYLPLSALVQGHYRQKSEIVSRPSVPPPLPPSRPATSCSTGSGPSEFSYMQSQVPLRKVMEAEAAGAAAAALSAPATVTCVPPSWIKKMKVIKKLKRRIGSMGSQKAGTNFNNLPPLRFDTSIHGDNVLVSPDGRIASRNISRSFCKAIVFTDRPVKIQEKVCLYLREIATDWSGVLRFGFTSVNPVAMRNCLPRYVCPDLTCRPGFWAKAFSDSLLVAESEALLTFHLTSAGEVHFSVNGRNKGVFLTGVDTRKPLWAIVDVYGNTTCVELIDPRVQVINNNLRATTEAGAGSPQPPRTPRMEPRYVTTTSLPATSAVSQPRHSHSLSYIQACTPPRSSNTSASSLYHQTTRRPAEYFEMSALTRALPQSTPATPERRLPTSAVPRASSSSQAGPSSSSVYQRVPCQPPTYTVMNVQVEHQQPLPLVNKCNGQYYDCGQQKVVVRTAPNTPKVLRASDDYETIYSCKSAVSCVTAPTPSCSSSSSSLKAKIQSIEDYEVVCSSSPPKPTAICANDDSPSKEQPLSLECLACCERPVDSVFYSCGHMCMCYQCAVGYWRSDEKGHCPICRAAINDVIRTYM